MKFGVIPINVGFRDADQILAIARHAENSAVESLWTFEHVMVPADYQSKYPYSASGKMGAGPDTNFFDPLITLANVAAHTETVRLATGVNILPQANPLLLAKQAATLDVLSKGRFMLGVGIGWLREEFEAMGVPFERRGARFDDYVMAMKRLWSGGLVEHRSEFLDWSGFGSYPLPLQQPNLPVIVGGAKGRAFERIARLGDGWFAPTSDVDQLRAMLPALQAACAAVSRDPDEIEITCMWDLKGGLETVWAFAELGVERLTVPMQALGLANPMDGISKLADDVISRV